MALQSILLQGVQREVIKEIPDARYNPYGGYFGEKIPDKPRTRRELLEFDTRITNAAPIVALGAKVTPQSVKPNQVVENRSVQFIGAEMIGESDLEWLSGLPGQMPAAMKAQVLSWARSVQERNRERLAITRGYLLSSMVVGEINWAYLGITLPNVSFRMPSALKITPATAWRNSSDVPNTNSTPVSDIDAADYQAKLFGAAPFDTLGGSRSMFRAIAASTQYIAQANSVSATYRATSLPVFGTQPFYDLMSTVLRKKIVELDHPFNYENPAGGNAISGRYVPERLGVLWRESDEGSTQNWEFSNVPVLKTAVAAALGDSTFGGEVGYGPIPWAFGDRQEFLWAALAQIQDGIGVRRHRAVSAVIETRF